MSTLLPKNANSGNHIETNHGYCNQIIYQATPPRPVSQHWSNQMARLGVVCVTGLMLLISVWYLVDQWWPFLSGPIPAGGIAAHAKATLPVFWTAVSCSLGYGYCTLRVFKY